MANAKRPRKTTDAEADDDGMQVDLSGSDDEIQSPVVSRQVRTHLRELLNETKRKSRCDQDFCRRVVAE